MMGFDDIRSAIESRMAQWGDAAVVFDGIPKSQAALDAIENGEPWVRLTIQHGESTAPYKGAEPGIRRTGLVMCQVFSKMTPSNRGSHQAMDVADSLAEHLQFYRVDGLETLVSSLNRVGEQDGYYQVNLTTPFRAG